MSNVKQIEDEVNEILAKIRKKNSKELSMALIKPLTKDYSFCSNGIYLFSGSMGAGKSYEIMRHILISERLFDEPYYSLIVFCSTSGGLDKTVQAFLPKVKTPIAFMPDTSLLPIFVVISKSRRNTMLLFNFSIRILKNHHKRWKESSLNMD